MDEKQRYQIQQTIKDRLIQFVLVYGLAPLWVPIWGLIWLAQNIILQCQLFWYLFRPTESAWQRSADLWTAKECVYGRAVGPYFCKPFEHSLTEHFASYHRGSRTFLIEQLRNPNPYLVSYAFKCLIRYSLFDRQEIPAEVLSRSELIFWQPFGCMVESISLSEFMKQSTEATEIQTNSSALN